MEEIEKFVHDISDWLEALGFCVAILTAIKVFFLNRDIHTLERKFLFHVRIDDHIVDLKKSSSKLSKLITSFPQYLNQIKLEVSKCIEHCQSLRKKVRNDELTNLEPLLIKMKKLRDNKAGNDPKLVWWKRIIGIKHITGNQIEDVYRKLNALITEIEHLNNDLKKSIK